MQIAVDFDGTCVTHEFPKMGKDILAVPVLQELSHLGHELILLTMRDDNKGISPKSDNPNIVPCEGDFLTDAVNWFADNNIKLFSVNDNPKQNTWTGSRKVYADIYIDNMALGVPLLYSDTYSSRPFVDWCRVTQILFMRELISADFYANFRVLFNYFMIDILECTMHPPLDFYSSCVDDDNVIRVF